MATRREFVAGSVASVAMLSATAWGQDQRSNPASNPWQTRVRRCGQLNFNEIDPLTLDVNEWMDYWASLKCDAVMIGFGGIMATYPTKVPFHHRSKFLGQRDLTGEAVIAARKRNMRVIARIDCNYAFQDAFAAHPEWFMRRKDGSPRLEVEAAYLFKTCQFTTYFTEQMPRIYREIGELYNPDAYFTNGWPGTAEIEVCYCATCQKIYHEKTGGVPPATTDARSEVYRRFYDVYMARVVELWKFWDGMIKQHNPESFFFGDLGGSGLQMIKDTKMIGDVSAWYAGDHQGRTGHAPIWSCAAQGRIAQSVMDGRIVSNIVAAYSYNAPRYRHASSSIAEMQLWLAQTTACGMVPWEHWLGGSPRDMRWQQPAQKFFSWLAENEQHFRNKKSIANIAVLYPQRTIAFYQSNGTKDRRLNEQVIDPEDYLQGLYYALLEARLAFDFVHEEKITAETLKPYKALLIPNAAYMSDEASDTIRQYVASGGSVMATFETSRYNEWGDQREDFALHDLFGVSYAGSFPGGVIGPFPNAYMEVRSQHPVLRGFEGTEILPGPEYRVPVSVLNPEQLNLSVIPHYMNAMPEFIYPRIRRTNEPAAVLRQQGTARIAYFPGDVDRTAWKSGNPDFTHLIGNTVRWLMGENQPTVTMEGKGLLECFSWETEPGWALHLLNYTNPNAMRPTVQDLYPVGPLHITLILNRDRKIKAVRALRAGVDLKFSQTENLIKFVVNTVTDYEVVTLT